MASLGLVSPGAATDRVTLFNLEKIDALWKVMTRFSCRLLTTHIFPRRLPSVLSKFSHKKSYSGVTPWMVSAWAVRLPRPLLGLA